MKNQAAYLDIKNALIGKINQGKFADNESLPSERALSMEFNVSRMTARKALDQLEKEGYVDRIPRKGTFVRHKKLIRGSVLSGFGDALRNQGMTQVESIILKNETIDADEFLAEKLRIKIGDPVFLLSRVRCGDGVPYALETTHIPLDRFPGINRIDFSQYSLFQTMEKDYKSKVVTAERLIFGVHCDAYTAKHLKLNEGDAIFKINNVSYDGHKMPMEYLISYNPFDKTSFFYHMELKDSVDYTFTAQNPEEVILSV